MLEEENYNIEELVEKLKQRVEHKLIPKLLQDDTFYHRFLKARDFDLDQAEAMILKHLSDIKRYGWLKDTYKPPEFLAKYIPVNFLGYDKEGEVVIYIDFGQIDVRGILSIYSFDICTQYYAYFFYKNYERLKEQTKKLGRPITKLTLIVNFDQLSFSTITYKKGVEAGITGAVLFQDNFPESVKYFYVINCPMYFNMLFSIIKPFMSNALLDKLRYFGKVGWRESLLEFIEPDVLPVFLGGNRTDPDGNPQCLTFLTHGTKVTDEDRDRELRRKEKMPEEYGL